MRKFIALAVLALAACGPEEPKRAASDKVVEDVKDPGAMWPVLLAHCLRTPNCDPTGDFGQGAGQASNTIDQASWFLQSKDVVKEGGADYGAAITISLHAARAQGGKGGRPLTMDEAPDSLGGTNAMRSTLSIEYRTPGGAAPEPYGLAFRSAWLALSAPDVGEALLEITGKAGVLISVSAGAMPAPGKVSVGATEPIEPVTMFYPRNLRDEPLPKLMAAIDAGETLGLKLTAPGGVVLQDAIYTGGYVSALREATEALADAELPRTIPERCERFARQRPEFWKIADVTAALRVCDPRPVLQRQ